jgi:hypothetical protein
MCPGGRVDPLAVEQESERAREHIEALIGRVVNMNRRAGSPGRRDPFDQRVRARSLRVNEPDRDVADPDS